VCATALLALTWRHAGVMPLSAFVYPAPVVLLSLRQYERSLIPN